MKTISKLAQLFTRYRVYPNSCYNDCSPVKIFQNNFPENHYSKDLERFFFYQDYRPTQRGADLPWWGKKFFTEERGDRIMIISQDSMMEDAKSITLFAQLFQIVNNLTEYKKLTKLDKKGSYGFASWLKVKNQLADWGIDFDFLYITDASKVYKEGSWKDRNFNKEKSKELLESEIEFCNPNLIILLGAQPLSLLGIKNYALIVESGKIIKIKNKRCIVAPFFIGNGPAGNRGGKGFKKRLEIANDLIKKNTHIKI